MQQPFIDYYEVLQVLPKASQEVIQNAYRALAKKFHPDLYPDKDEATKIMALLNTAYSVLSDPNKRTQYDNLYFNKNERPSQKTQEANSSHDIRITPEMRQYFAALNKAKLEGEVILEKPDISLRTVNGIGATFYGQESFDVNSNSYITQHWFTILFFPIFPLGKYRVIRKSNNSYLIISKVPIKGFQNVVHMYLSKPFSLIAWCFIIALMFNIATDTRISNNSNAKPTTAVQNKAVQPSAQKQAPRPLPAFIPKSNVTTRYVENEPIANNGGYCTVTIDNKQNTFPVIVRLWSISSTAKPVRTFTIKQGEQFKVENISPGKYEVRFMHLYDNIQSTDVFKTEPFDLSQHDTPTGVNYDNVSFTLYKVPHGNARTYPISVNDL